MDDQEAATLDAAAMADVLRGHPTFSLLSEAATQALLRECELLSLAPGEVLIRQDEASDAAFLIVEGEVDVTVESTYGAVHLARLPAPSLLGDIGVLADLPRSATVTAAVPASALRIRREPLMAAVRDHSSVLLSVINQLGQRLNTINQAVGFYTHALAALERQDFDKGILDDLMRPVPELVNFAQTFRRMAEQIILRRAQREEMASASAIQQSMLPSPLPPDFGDGRVVVHAQMRPARDVGGDFFDYFPIGPSRLGIVIADVCGKGVPAALFMAITRTVIRLVAREHNPVDVAIRRANELLGAENDAMMFATLFYGEFDTATGMLIYCNCGHNPPLVIRGDGTTEELGATGLPLAVMPDSAYRAGTVTLAPGDRILLYTDGVTEAEDAVKAQFGDDRLGAAVAELRGGTIRELVEGVFRRVNEFAAGAPQSDDITCLALAFVPPPNGA